MRPILAKPTINMRMGQTIIGRTDQRYVIQGILHERKDNDHRVFLATFKNKKFVVKTVSAYQFQKAQTIKHALPHNTFVRVPVDENKELNALIYNHVREDLQQLAKRVRFSRSQIKMICHNVLQAIAELHDIDWMHGDIKSENVVIDFTTMPNGSLDIQRAYLIDTENALPVKDEHYMYGIEVGHRFWRSPEAHAQRMIGKPTDIFSFGLVVVHLLLGGKHFILDPGPLTEEEDPMVAGLERISHYFGEYPEDFAKRLDDGLPENERIWCRLLGFLNSELKRPGNYEPFFRWNPAKVAREDSAFVWRFMSKLDPLDRTRARELLNNDWFNT